MLTPSMVQEMVALTARLKAGSVSREDWSNLAALTLIAQGKEMVAAIQAGGYRYFVGIVAPIYHGHGFRRDDYRRIYKRVCRAAPRLVTG